MATQLPHLPDVEQLSTNVIRILGGNPNKFTLQGTNTYLLGCGRTRILLDTGEGRLSWKACLSSVLKSHNTAVSTCLLTHWHHDHIGGVADLLALCPDAKVYKYSPTLSPDGLLKYHMNVREIEDGQSFDTPSPSSDGSTATPFTLTAVHTPGHTADHLSFLITSSPDPSEPGALFTGDNVLGHGTAVFEDLATYLSSLHLMSSRIGATARAYPAHGAVIEDGKGKIEGYIAHREQREQEALSVLRTGRVGAGVDGASEGHQREWASMEIVKIIYKGVPEELHKPAEGGLLQVLSKLEGEGRVRKVGVKWRIVKSEEKKTSL